MTKLRFNLVTLFGFIVALFAIANTNAVGTISNTNPLVIEQAEAADQCSSSTTCETIPAIAVTNTDTQTNTTTTTNSYTKKVVKATIIEKIKTIEKVKKVRIAIHQKAKGVPKKVYKTCIDPVKKKWIKPNGWFKNTRKYVKGHFDDKWDEGLRICNPKLVKINGQWYWRGTKSNCGNEDILIPVKPPKKAPPKYVPVVEYQTVAEFEKVYEEWVTSTVNEQTNTNTTTTAKVTYVCPTGWTLEGTMCKRCQTTQNCKPSDNKDGTQGAGDGNAGSPINEQPGAGDSNTAPSADCYLLDGNNDPTIKGKWNNTTKKCEAIPPAI